MTKTNIGDGKGLRPCTGCGICGSLCPVGAITIELTPDGFYQPAVTHEQCIECGRCLRSCYRYDEQPVRSDEHIRCLSAINKNSYQLEHSSSGGVSIVLMEECLRQGYKVMGCAYDSATNRAVSVVATTPEELEQFYGSKYFPSYTTPGFDEIIADNTARKYALFGTPCHIYAFSKTQKYQRHPERYLLVDIFCHGCPSKLLWDSYLHYTKKLTATEQFQHIVFRSKSRGWHAMCYDFIYEDKKYTSQEKGDPFYTLFLQDHILNQACYNCTLRSTLAYSDIRLGDYWGSRYEQNRKGVSAVAVNSPKGAELMQAVDGRLLTDDAELDDIISGGQSYGRSLTYSPTKRTFLLKSLKNGKELGRIFRRYKRMVPLRVRVKKWAYRLALKLPPSLFAQLKSTYHRVR